jgi:N6-L-threonylcarbamoyladenine synthase
MDIIVLYYMHHSVSFRYRACYNLHMRILGIETSCDETAVCLIEAEGEFGPDFRFGVLGNALLSQAALHAQYGGVFPNLAKREHAKTLVPLLKECLAQAGVLQAARNMDVGRPDLEQLLQREPELLEQLQPVLDTYQKPDLDAIAVTAGPGLEPALWVGVNFAKALSLAWGVPLVAVDHMEGHIILSLMKYSDILKNMRMSGALGSFEFPVLALLISGGHTELVLSREFGRYESIGETRDDAAGEAFDKVARMLGLPYPGGPEISRLAAEARARKLAPGFTFTRPMLHEPGYDFSFSGLKTAVRNLVQGRELTDEFKMRVAREFEECVADVLVEKTLRAVEAFGANTVVVGGGVSANTFIRARLTEALKEAGDPAQLLVPPPELATDNALMIALAGYFHAFKKEFANASMLTANGNLELGA